jgi:hypothetical protein
LTVTEPSVWPIEPAPDDGDESGARQAEVLEENLPQCRFFHYISDVRITRTGRVFLSWKKVGTKLRRYHEELSL